MKADVYNKENKVVGTVELPEGVFGVKWNAPLVHQVLVAQDANYRSPWAHAKGRGEVRGGGKKPWRQKGTGRARHGSIRSPLWRKGGKAHGPVSERDYGQKVNKKMKRLALFSVLSKKFSDNEVKVFETLEVNVPKTKELAAFLRPALNVSKKKKELSVILIPEASDASLSRAARNIPKTKVLAPTSLNVRDLLDHKAIFIDQDAVKVIATHYAK